MTTLSRLRHTRYQGAALVLVVLTFALRLWGLNASSLWYDETFMLELTQQGVVPGVLGLLREDNALPLHGLLLAIWMQLAGDGEFAVRYLSVLLGVMGAPFVFKLGRSLYSRQSSGLGALLAYATLPIFVYYSQEVRMYALAVPLAAGFAWMSWRLITLRHGATGYVILGWLMMAAHLYTGFLWVATAIWGTLSLLVASVDAGGWISTLKRLTRQTMWWRANLLLALTAFPIVIWALWRTGIDTTAVSAIPADAMTWLPVMYGIGQYVPAPWSALFLLLVALLLTIAIAGAVVSSRRRSALWIIMNLAMPVVALFALTSIKAKWSERYLLPSLGLALVVGCGTGWEYLLCARQHRRDLAAWILRTSGVLLLALWIGLVGPALARSAEGTWALALQDEWHPKPDFRHAAAYIEAHDTPRDAIVVVGGYAVSALDYYYDGPARLFGLPLGRRTLDTSHPIDLSAFEVLQQQVAGQERLWLLLWQDHLADPTGLIQSVLIASCHRLPVDSTFTNLGLLLFDLRSCGPLDRIAKPPLRVDAAFEAPIQLLGYEVLQVESTWEVDLWWAATGPITDDYTVFVHLVGPDGYLIDQHDHIAGADAYPTSRWVIGTRLRDRFFLYVPDKACENCRLRVGLYTGERRLPYADGTDILELPVAPFVEHVD